ncbi:MAG: TonB-dependent receptor [Owenweeksia sp.]|nr:TonB-dependent receptor [Owenweeksia sp.]
MIEQSKKIGWLTVPSAGAAGQLGTLDTSSDLNRAFIPQLAAEPRSTAFTVPLIAPFACLPTLTFTTNWGAVGSRSLKPEHSLNYELGYKWITEKVFLNVSAFRKEGTDIIDWVQKCKSCKLRAPIPLR